MYAADDLKWGPLSCQYKQHSIRPRKITHSGICIILQITQKTNPIISLLFIQKFVIIKPVVFVLFFLCFKALFLALSTSHNSRKPLLFCTVFPALLFPFIFWYRSVIDRGFPNLVNGSYFLCRISREISANQKLRNVLNELIRTRTSFLRK